MNSDALRAQLAAISADRRKVLQGAAGLAAIGFAGGSLRIAGAQDDELLGESGELTIYSGRAENLIAGVIEIIEEEGDLSAEVAYGSTGEMALRILEEGENSPADLFVGQDAGALGQLANDGRLAELPAEILDRVDPRFASPDGLWVGLSARARTLTYNTDLVDPDTLPASMLDLTDSEWEGRVAWAPGNASFQAHVTAMRRILGEDETREWLEAMDANGTHRYDGNGGILTAIIDGEVETGLINHYYLWERLREFDELPAENYYFPDGDIGALVNIAGAAIIEDSSNEPQALRALDVLLSEPGQEYFANNTSEYPLAAGVQPRAELPDLESIQTPDIDLSDLADLEGTVALLTEVGLI